MNVKNVYIARKFFVVELHVGNIDQCVEILYHGCSSC
nr:MAG TPA: hypothetical protein [Caudoviricetes sp.]